MLLKKKKKSKNSVIDKAKKIIKEEKKKIKEEKKRIRHEKYKDNIIYKFFKDDQVKDNYTAKEVSRYMIVGIVMGMVFCFLLIFTLSGGKNFILLNSDLKKLVNVYDKVVKNYYTDIDKDKMVDDAINGMLSSIGDVYTNYSDLDSTISFDENVVGTYEGIGAMVYYSDSKIVVNKVYNNMPAAKAGLQEGDIITKVDGVSYTDKNQEDLANYVKSSNNSSVVLTVMRDGVEKDITIKRSKIEVPVVNSNIFNVNNKKIGYISISVFTSVANKQFETSLKELEKKNIDGLIIDVRDNGGGYLSSVTDICSLFLEKGKVIYQLDDGKKITSVKDKTKTKRTYPVAVLTNELSGSASEILASTIKESYKGFIVGTNTYGKGTVQQVSKLSDGTMIKYTIEKWLTPDGNWINDVGVSPTDYVEQSEAYYTNPLSENDAQLNKALELVSKLVKTTNINLTSLYESYYMRPLSEVRFQGYIYENMIVSPNGLGYIKISDKTMKEFGVDAASAGNMINNLKYVNEIIVWVFLSEDVKSNIIRANIRSRGPFINEVAIKHGGGGHKYASGVRLNSWEDADKLISDLDNLVMDYKNNK